MRITHLAFFDASKWPRSHRCDPSRTNRTPGIINMPLPVLRSSYATNSEGGSSNHHGSIASSVGGAGSGRCSGSGATAETSKTGSSLAVLGGCIIRDGGGSGGGLHGLVDNASGSNRVGSGMSVKPVTPSVRAQISTQADVCTLLALQQQQQRGAVIMPSARRASLSHPSSAASHLGLAVGPPAASPRGGMTAAAEALMPNRDLTHEIAAVAEVGGCTVDQYGTSGDEAAVHGSLVKMPEMLRRHVQERMMQKSQHGQALGFGGAPGFSPPRT